MDIPYSSHSSGQRGRSQGWRLSRSYGRGDIRDNGEEQQANLLLSITTGRGHDGQVGREGCDLGGQRGGRGRYLGGQRGGRGRYIGGQRGGRGHHHDGLTDERGHHHDRQRGGRGHHYNGPRGGRGHDNDGLRGGRGGGGNRPPRGHMGRGGRRGKQTVGHTGGRNRQLVHRLDFGEIMNLAKQDSDDIISALEQDLKGFQHSLSGCDQVKGSSRFRYVEAIIQIMFNVSLEENESSSIIMAEFLSDRCSTFHLLLSEYVQTTDIHSSLMTIHMLCHLCEFILNSSRTNFHVPPIKHLQDVIPSSIYPDLSARVESMVQLQKEIQISLQRQHKTANTESSHFENWDNSLYRQMSILPTVKEIVGAPPPLRSNIIKGSYTGWEHYYDVQFRLLREDFVAPLRKGIAEFCCPNRSRRLNEVYIYNGVRILRPVCTHEGLCYNVQFDASRMRLYRSWEHSKRLLFGSLLCFTMDHFGRSIFFATVTNRDPKELQNGIFQVRFEKSIEMLYHIEKTVFVVVESKAFFEASRHILRSLQTAEVDTMPFSRYLVLNKPLPVNPPKYFESSSAMYDLKWLYKNSHKHQRHEINVLDDKEWPRATDPGVELDQSQLDAIRKALTQEIAVIQGPPGTGKTYIGYKIVQTLLQNRNVWDPHKTSPILVMCFTNHALDQFLEGIIHHKISDQILFGMPETRNPKIVRIGGRSQSEEIQKYSLKNFRRGLIPWQLYEAVNNIKVRYKKLGANIEWKNEQFQKVVHKPGNDFTVSIDGIRQLKPYILPSHFYQIMQLANSDKEIPFTIEIWLGLMVKIEKEKQYSTKQENDEIYNEGVVIQQENVIQLQDTVQTNVINGQFAIREGHEDVENIDVTGEATLESETRQLEGDNYTPIQAKEGDAIENDTLNFFMQKSAKPSSEEEATQESEGAYVLRGKNHNQRRFIFKRINDSSPLEEEDEATILDITDPSFSMEERYQLFRLWIKKFEENLTSDNQLAIAKYDEMCKEWKTADQNLDRIALEHAEVIGMTTSGAARYQHIIHLVKPKIVIVEEAAELLESHIVSALNAGTQHLILIGDHKQLRPKPNEYDLAMKHNLHISLFERLLLNDLPHATLMIQHRMRPQIASLVHPHIYEELENHESVTRYDNVKGFKKNMYFFHHEHKEEHDVNLSSHSNEYEANFIAHLCRHLLKLGYEPTQITILTAYTGQLLKVRSKMPKKSFEGIRITNVDNFQGEENDIIILSLVRNNDDGKVGFLKEENRVCVALSRARKGLYCFGNFKLLRNQVPIWREILSQVELDGCLGSAFPLGCPNHANTTFDVSEPEDFDKYSPEGGCVEDCKYQLDSCGHTCIRKCHIDDPDHTEYKCRKVCMRPCEAGLHNCKAFCYTRPCPPCRNLVIHEIPSCGHEQQMICYEDPMMFQCQTPCPKLCPNNLHHCPLKCSDICQLCSFIVSREILICGHKQNMMCHEKVEDFQCLQPCQKICPAGLHILEKACSEDFVKCTVTVRKKLPNCDHYKDMPCCFEPSAHHKCEKKCLTIFSCGHSCPKKCFEECDKVCKLLQQKQVPKCGHTENVPCFIDAKYWTCTKPCANKLLCGHTCNRKCGQVCSLSNQCTEQRNIILPCQHEDSVECKDYIKIRMMILKDQKVECLKGCKKKLLCGHSCMNRCSDPCTVKCIAKVDKTCPKGFHKLKVNCGDIPPSCKKNCMNKLPCGHPCKMKCNEECNSKSCDMVIKRRCACGHTHNSKCGDQSCNCKEKCDTILECGHKCSGNCRDCFSSRIHAPCPFEVHAKRFCGHYASVPCFGLEDKCTKPCQVASCLHTSNPCEHKCYESCETECTEPCQYECTHNKCTMLCSEECNVHPCSKPCNKMLDCGHQCLGLCGEKCLSHCVICNRKKFISPLAKGLPNKSPKPESFQYIQLSCNHLFTVNFLDKYYQSQQGKDRLVSPLLCPTCQKIIVCNRYSTTIRERQQEIEEIKMRVPNTDCEDILDHEAIILKRAIIKNLSLDNHLFGNNINLSSAECVLLLKILFVIDQLHDELNEEDSYLQKVAKQLFKCVVSISKTGKLSVQLINDIKREIYRINLLYMASQVETLLKHIPTSNKSVIAFNDVMKSIDQTETNNSCLNEQVYKQLVDTLKQLFKQLSQKSLTEPVNIEQISCPVVTKGQWYRCAKAGHYYFVPAKYHTGKAQTSCEQCKDT